MPAALINNPPVPVGEQVRAALAALRGQGRRGGCTRDSRECAWNAAPTYTRPDCCTSHLLEVTSFVHELLAAHGILHWLDWGALLGAVRSGEFIPWDNEVDIGILERDLDAFRSLVPAIEREGYAVDLDHLPGVISVAYSPVNRIYAEVRAWKLEDGLLTSDEIEELFSWPGMYGRSAIPARYLEDLETVTLYGRSFPAPSPVHEFLREHRFGPDYMTPTRRVFGFALTRPPDLADMTPAALELLPLVDTRGEHLLRLARSQSALMRRGLVEPGLGSWAIVAGLPGEPTERHLAAARAHLSADDGGPAVEKLVYTLGWIERAIETYEQPSSLAPLRRICWRLARLVRGGYRRATAAIR